MKVSMDTKDLNKRLKTLSRDINKAAEETVIEMAQLGSKQLAIRTKPYGITGNSKLTAEKAIFKDVNKVYQNVGVTYNTIKKYNIKKANAYAYAMNHGETQNAENIARSVLGSFRVGNVDSGQRLESNRKSNGRVIVANNPIGVADESQIASIKDQKKISAGLAKSGWIQAGKSIGAKARIPAWLRKSMSGLGSSKTIKAGWKTTVTLINHVRYASDVIKKHQINAAIKNAYKNQVKKMQRQVDSISKRF